MLTVTGDLISSVVAFRSPELFAAFGLPGQPVNTLHEAALADGGPDMTIRIELVDWATAEPASTAIRRAVFQEEQGIPAELDLDGTDAACRHGLATVGEQPAGVARLDGNHIQRVAVLPQFRGRGIAGMLIERLTEAAAQDGRDEIVAEAQPSSVPIFRRLGFEIAAEEQIIVGISHRHVRKALTRTIELS